MSQTFTPHQVADFLTHHPEFFHTHAQLFTSLRVPHPHEGKTVSLAERQNLVLRETIDSKQHEINTMITYARENEAINNMLLDWCRDLLGVKDEGQLPSVLVDRLKQVFNVPEVTIRLWDTVTELDSPWSDDVGAKIKEGATQMRLPYCGLAADIEPATWLDSSVKSVAVISLRVGYAPDAFGLLVLGSPDPSRFTQGMGTDFLQRIGEFASASLSRLLD